MDPLYCLNILVEMAMTVSGKLAQHSKIYILL